MATCPSCGSHVSDGGRFCSSCGSALGSDDMETLEVGAPASAQARKQTSASARKTPSSSGSLLTEGRFLPGRLLAERYRIVALLGKGGMGEVYRADDLTLGQPVALKFLPEEATRDEAMLERFRNEVRISRRVSHPNVCRVYDVGEVDGHTFFTMEYVDGEDLASLLRRIGRLPSDKALEIARQLCAGLAAAHAKGVLHRDLKPANIMLDGRGQVVVTDFGLAGFVEQIVGPDVRSGTPAYMSPEQLAGKEVTEKSDIYSLGLVLYEIFTGKRAFHSETLAELVRARNESAPSRPSSLVKDLDPAVERVIMRCLEADPPLRPSSVLNVAAALPGGDPLAAALAAGETPSPQMVAAAGETAGLAPRTALLCLVGLIAGLALFLYLSAKTSGMGKLGLEQSPDVLAQKAKDIIPQLGYSAKPTDSASGFSYFGFEDYVQKNTKPPIDWAKVLGGRPGALEYWYRQSPDYLLHTEFHDNLLTPGVASWSDPPPVLSGMVNIKLDVRGRLLFLEAIPPQKGESSAQSAAPDWSPLFAAAALDPAQLQPAAPLWNSLAASDSRAAWMGKWPGTDWPLRVEAAALGGKPVFFSLIGPWTTPDRMQQNDSNPGRKAAGIIFVSIFVSVLFGAAVLARRNYRQGRGDRQGALRLAYVVFALAFALWLCRGHLVPALDLLMPFFVILSTALLLAAVMWIVYLALEPYVRRRWPQALISWSRLLMGQVRDPLVGRDLLFGVLLALFWLLMFGAATLVAVRLGDAPDLKNADYLSGGILPLGAWLFRLLQSIQSTLALFFVMFILRVLLRKEWLAAVAFIAIFATQDILSGSGHLLFRAGLLLVVYTIIVLVVFRVGFITLATALFVTNLLGSVPLTLDTSAWYFGAALFPLLSVVALALWGFYTSLAGRKLWKADAFN